MTKNDLRTAWVGEIPDDWRMVRASLAATPVERPPLPDDEVVTCFRDGEVTLRSNRRTDGFTVSLQEIGYQHIEKGDLVIHSMDGGWGAIGVSDSNGKASPVVHAYRSDENDVKFIAYVLRAMAYSGYLIAQTKGIRERSTQFDKKSFSNLYLPLPDIEAQRRLADYLDKEISEIDALIEEFEGLVRELEIRKLLLPDSKINHQGALVPTVPAKLLTRITTGEGDTQDAIEDGEFPFYVRSDTVRASDKWTFEGPAVLTSGDGAGVGKIFHYSEGKFRAHQRVYVLRNFTRVDPKYFYWCFQTNFPRQVEHGGAKATVESVRMNMVADTPIPLPPLDKQRGVAEELDREFERMDALIEESTQLIENLKARKTALITEVVTGRKEI